MTEYVSLFSEKYLTEKLSLNDFVVPDIETKLNAVSGWVRENETKNIYTKKEEQLQSDFLNDIFGKVLDYAYERGLNEYNLEKEEKSKTDGTKPDGVLGYLTTTNKDIRVVIELKDAYTNLDHKQNRKNDNRTPVEQAFSYVSKSGGNCKWVIVSNFVEIRLYPSNDSSSYQKFYVKDLGKPEVLKKFYAMLAKDRLFELKSESIMDKLLKNKIEADKSITNRFYDDYKKCRTTLFNHIKENNPDIDDNLVLTKSQKILDRIIFVCFCEDIGLLPYKIFRTILNDAKNSRFDTRETKLWERTKSLFNMIDKGYPSENINRFNGGLFKEDPIIDNFIIKDSVLEGIILLEAYDFESDLNVNILGHIFEQSITDLEEIKASFSGQEINKKDGKRKKDGIFYTPEYITKYIVEEAVGGWLEDKKIELGYYDLPKFTDDELIRLKTGNTRKKNAKIKAHLDFWLKYREALNNITVLDPACGSGSFLVQVFDYLKEQRRLVNEEIANFEGQQPTLFNVDHHILSHNIYGVDLNAESVEITKLALWLKTANKNDPLTSLDNNIKCGNSLVDDPEIDPEHAFDWNKEVADIISRGGFDVIVGNPPYVYLRNNNMGMNERLFYRDKYVLYSLKPRTDIYFFEKGFCLLQKKGYLGFIAPNNILTINSLSKFRKHILENYDNIKIINNKEKIFNDANVDTMIMLVRKSDVNQKISIYEYENNTYNFIGSLNNIQFMTEDSIISYDLFSNERTFDIIKKIEQKAKPLMYFADVSNGIVVYKKNNGIPKQTEDMIKNRIYHSYSHQDESWIPYIGGSDLKRYKLHWSGEYVKYGENIAEKRGKVPFNLEHISVRVIPSNPPYCINATLIDSYMLNDQNYMVVFNSKQISLLVLLGILNSKLLSFWFVNKLGKIQRGLFPQFKAGELKLFPISYFVENNEKELISCVDIMLNKNKELQELSDKFYNLLKGDFKDIKINSSLSDWYNLDWTGFVELLQKQKITLIGSVKDDWYDRFNRLSQQAKTIKSTIDITDKQIDSMVYKLYGLTDEEINIIENDVK